MVGASTMTPTRLISERSGIKAPSVAGEIARGAKDKETAKAKEKKRARRVKERATAPPTPRMSAGTTQKAKAKGRRAAVSAPYRIVNGVEYLSSNCKFGETVMTKLPKPANKAQKRWIRGVRVGKLDTHTHIYIYTYIHLFIDLFVYIYIYISPPVHKYIYR